MKPVGQTPAEEAQTEQEASVAPNDDESQTKNPKMLRDQPSSDQGVHRRRTLYLVRHGEAVHNVLEAKAQETARLESQSMNLSKEETHARMEAQRQAILQDPSLRDARLTDKGRQQARDCGKRLQELIDQGLTHPPTEAMVSPLARTLETCQLILDSVNPDIKAHIRPELQERQTHFPPDTPRRHSSMYRPSNREKSSESEPRTYLIC